MKEAEIVIKKTVLDMRKLYELREKGYQWRTIARVLNVNPETVRTILGGVGQCGGRRSLTPRRGGVCDVSLVRMQNARAAPSTRRAPLPPTWRTGCACHQALPPPRILCRSAKHGSTRSRGRGSRRPWLCLAKRIVARGTHFDL